MNDVVMSELRRANIRSYIRRNKLLMKDFAARAGISQAHLSQLVGKGASRNVTEAMARRIEERVGMVAGLLDSTGKAGSVYDSPVVSQSMLARIERLERAIGLV